MSFMCSSTTGDKVARMKVIEWRLDDVGDLFLELVMILISIPEYENNLFRCECRGQERRIHSTEMNNALNTISMGGTPIVSEWHLVSN